MTNISKLQIYPDEGIKEKGLTIQQLADFYDDSTPEVQKLMHDNVDLWNEKPE